MSGLEVGAVLGVVGGIGSVVLTFAQVAYGKRLDAELESRKAAEAKGTALAATVATMDTRLTAQAATIDALETKIETEAVAREKLDRCVAGIEGRLSEHSTALATMQSDMRHLTRTSDNMASDIKELLRGVRP